MINPQDLCQLEIAVSDAAKAVDFYEHVFGWPPVPVDIHGYIVLEVPKDCRFGISLAVSPQKSQTAPSELGTDGKDSKVLYFSVNEPESIVALAQKHGGSLLFGPRVLPSYGTIWQITDPDGNRWGIHQRKAPGI